MSFLDRRDAGIQLGVACQHLLGEQPTVLGLVRGGIPVAFEVARALGAPLDALGVRKIGMPSQPELALGAVSEEDALFIDPDMQVRAGVTNASVQRFVTEARLALRERMGVIRNAVPVLPVRGRTVVVVDDGIATGATMVAALQCLRSRDVGRIVLATPVAPPEALDRCRGLVDEIVCLLRPESFGAVGYWYDDFSTTTDSEVVRLLRLQRSAAPSQVARTVGRTIVEQDVTVPIEGPLSLQGELVLPDHARALIVFAHGAGSNRLSPRNKFVADRLAPLGFASLRLDLLSADEMLEREKGFAFPLLATRVRAALDWAMHEPALAELPIVLYGASTGAAVALLVAASDRRVRAVISRGGRGDLVPNVLDQIHVPCLFLIGSRDDVVRELSDPVIRRLGPRASLRVIPGAGHLFEEPNALVAVCDQSAAFLDVALASPTVTGQTVQVSRDS